MTKGANPWTQADFNAKAPGMDWNAFLDAAALGEQQDFIVWQPKAVAGLSRLVATEPLEVWKDYLAFHALDRAAAYLPKKFADARFAFHGTALSGTPQQSDRWKRAVDDANHAVGEAIGKRYVEKHFDARTKERADEMAKNIIAAFAKRIDALVRRWGTDVLLDRSESGRAAADKPVQAMRPSQSIESEPPSAAISAPIPAKMKAIRAKENLTQEDFCREVDISLSSWKKYEASITDMGLAPFLKVANHP